ncbi:MAG TPA: hypothetical protein VFJ85_03670 [Acidimicrobiales bacterium]|nr:hypothetical protein [Acidimicrobiales bacterium]
MTALAGRVSAGGAGVAGAVVAAFGPERPSPSLASAVTGADGRFALVVDGEVVGGLLLARCGLGPVGLATAPAGPEVELALDGGPALHRLTVVAEGPAPPELDLQLTPRRIDGLDDEVVGLVHAPVDGEVHSMLAVLPLGGPGRVDVDVQGGRWLLYAAHESAPDALGADGRHVAWQVESATVGGRPADRGFIGHEVEVTGPTTVTLHIRRIDKG